MGRIKIVLLFNEDDERQNEVAKFLKTQQRCKTALITGLLHEWLQKQKGVSPAEVSLPVKGGGGIVEEMKEALLADRSFIGRISDMVSEQSPSDDISHKKPVVMKKEAAGSELDLDEDMLLAGLSMFETQM